MTPIPGTDQYKEFRQQGLLTEPNLDRYDGACVTWRDAARAPALAAADS